MEILNCMLQKLTILWVIYLQFFRNRNAECGILEVDDVTSSSFHMSWLAPCRDDWAGVDEYRFDLSDADTGEDYGDLM